MHFPPYQLLDTDHVARAEEKFQRLARLYHVGQRDAWDGKKVLAELLHEHGGIHLDDDKREAIGKIFSVILWGELAAWTISADIALKIDDVEAKMAATSQAFDEARHFYVMRDYLLELGGEIPRLDGYTHVVLNDLLETENLTDKVLGMQLIVENVALAIFRAVAQTGVEPVLCDLMPYYEKDESRHVGLGVLYLPWLLRSAGRVETLRLQLHQLKIVTLITWGVHAQQPYYEALGIDAHASVKRAMKLQRETFLGMRGMRGEEHARKAVLVGNDRMDDLNDQALNLFFPRPGATVPAWQRALLDVCHGIGVLGDRFLRATTA